MKATLLFVCTGNSCRSQMAEGWARYMASTEYPEVDITVLSAGLETHGVNPRAIATMARHGVDISGHHSDLLTEELINQSNLVVTVCAHADSHCPILPAGTEKLHTPFDDPAGATGSEEEIDEVFDRVCLEIKAEMQKILDKLVVVVSK